MKQILIKFSLLSLLLVFMSACSHKEENDNTFIWDCSEEYQTDSLNLQDFFSEEKITLLKETKKSRIGSIQKVMVKDSIIFVLDERLAKKIFTFNAHNGKFINNVGRLGHSKEEYTSIQDFGVDTEKKLIYCLCDMDKVKVYDYNGNFISTHDLGIIAYRMVYHNGKFHFISTDPGKGNLIIMDQKFNLVKQHFINEPGQPELVMVEPIQIRWDGKIIYRRYLDNNIYVLDENDEPQILYSLNFGKNSFKLEEIKGLEDNEEKEKVNSSRGDLRYFAESKDIAYILFYDCRKPIVSIWDKRKNKIFTCPSSNINGSKVGKFPAAIRNAFSESFINTINPERINEKIVTNKHIYSGDNPALYRLHQ